MAGVAGEAAVVPVRPRHPARPTVPSPEHAELLRALECIDLMDASEKEEEDDVLVVGVVRPAAVTAGALMVERQQQRRQRGGQDAGPSSLQPVAINVASPAVLSLEQRLLLRMANRQQHPTAGQQTGVVQPSPGLLAIRHRQRQQQQQAAAASSSSPAAAGGGSLLSSASSDEGQRLPASGGVYAQGGSAAGAAAAAAQLAGLSLSRSYCSWEDSPSGSLSSPASAQARSAAQSGSGFGGSGSGAGSGMPGGACLQDAGQPEAARKRARSGRRQDVVRYPGGDRARVSVTAAVTGWSLETARTVAASHFQSPAGAVPPDRPGPHQGGGLVAMEVIEIPDSATPVPLRRRLEQQGSHDSDAIPVELGQGSGASLFPQWQQPHRCHVIDLLSDDGEDE